MVPRTTQLNPLLTSPTISGTHTGEDSKKVVKDKFLQEEKEARREKRSILKNNGNERENHKKF